MSGSDLDSIYRNRFAGREAGKDAVWRQLAGYLQRYVPRDGRVLDVACDRGYFIRHIAAAERWASDVRDVADALGPEVRFVRADGLELADRLPAASFDAVFLSNYLEHLPTGDAVVEQLRIVFRLLAPGGRVIVLQPNIRLTGAAYWDYIDHRVALTERSLEEAALAAGLETEALVKRFLPYTTRSSLPQRPLLVRAYLALPARLRPLAGQTLYVGRRPRS